MTMPQASDTAAPATLLGSEQPLCTAYDVALLDLDGVCFAGQARVPHAADNVNAARAAAPDALRVKPLRRVPRKPRGNPPRKNRLRNPALPRMARLRKQILKARRAAAAVAVPGIWARQTRLQLRKRVEKSLIPHRVRSK